MCGYRGRGITKALIKKFQPVRNFPGRLKNIYLLENDLVEVLLAASDYYAVFKLVGGLGLADVGDLLIVDSNAALLDVAAGVGLGGAEP